MFVKEKVGRTKVSCDSCGHNVSHTTRERVFKLNLYAMSPTTSEMSGNNTKAIPPSRFYARLPVSTPLKRRLRTPEAPKKVTVSQPTTTPRSKKTSGNYKFSSEFHRRKSLNQELASETAGHFLGAVPPTEFLNMFLPIAPSSLPCPANESPFAYFKLKMREHDMYSPFVSGLCLL